MFKIWPENVIQMMKTNKKIEAKTMNECTKFLTEQMRSKNYNLIERDVEKRFEQLLNRGN